MLMVFQTFYGQISVDGFSSSASNYWIAQSPPLRSTAAAAPRILIVLEGFAAWFQQLQMSTDWAALDASVAALQGALRARLVVRPKRCAAEAIGMVHVGLAAFQSVWTATCAQVPVARASCCGGSAGRSINLPTYSSSPSSSKVAVSKVALNVLPHTSSHDLSPV